MKIGMWVARQGTQGLTTRWHLIESMIIGMPVTRCGRYLPLRNGRGVLATVDEKLMAGGCYYCAHAPTPVAMAPITSVPPVV